MNTQPIISVVALVDAMHAIVEAKMVPIFRAAMIKGLHKSCDEVRLVLLPVESRG